jgi:sugar transferase (PEP-CTERM/EpsH1 system associated)
MVPKKIHVVFLINQTPPIGGIQNFLINLVHRIDQTKFRTTVINFIHSEPLVQSISQEVCPVLSLNKKPGFDWGLIRNLAGLIKGKNPDIIQMHNWGSLVEGFLAGSMAGHTRFVHAERGTLNRSWKNIMVQQLLWRRMDRVLCVSEAHKKEIIETIHFPSSRIHSIVNGVDVDKFQPNAEQRVSFRKEIGLTEEHICIGSVGYLRPIKNHILLMKAGKDICHQYHNVRICLIGEGPEKEKLMFAAQEYGIQDQVIFCGSRHDIPLVLNGMDVFVLPSLNEGLPNAVLEAMATGIPVIASHVGGIPEVLQDEKNGLLFTSNDSVSLTKKLKDIIDNPKKRKMLAENGRHRVVSQFSLSSMVKKYEEVYQSLVA